jgi:GNAT superfamily N-acetyltransferase
MGRGQQGIQATRLSARRGAATPSLDEVRGLHPSVGIEASETNEAVIISLLRVAPEERGSGRASAALEGLLAYADRAGKLVALSPEPLADSKGLSKASLAAWYARHGFRPNSGRSRNHAYRETHIRQPR